MPKILSIDTSNNKKTSLELDLNGDKKNLFSESELTRSESVIPLIDKALKENKTSLEEIDEIKVNTGPGSFTGLRVGVAIANALGYLLKRPVNNKKIGELEKPVYNN